MTLPDAHTLNRLCREQRAYGQCDDSNCDACVIQRSMLAAHEVRSYVHAAMMDIARNGADGVENGMLMCMTGGFLLGVAFERERRRKTQ